MHIITKQASCMSRVAEARVGLNVDKLLPVVIRRNVDFLDRIP